MDKDMNTGAALIKQSNFHLHFLRTETVTGDHEVAYSLIKVSVTCVRYFLYSFELYIIIRLID